VNKGNVLDLEHFSDTYTQVKRRLKKGSLVVFDKGANTTDNLKIILDAKMDYLTSMKLNTSDDKIIEKFDLERAELIDSKKGIYGIKIVKPSSIKYSISLIFTEKAVGSKSKSCDEKVTGSKRDS